MKRNKCVYEYRIPETEGGHAYYVGQGNYERPYRPHPYKGHKGNFCMKPTDKNQIVIIKDNLTEQEAKDLEIKLIAKHGRRSLGEGYLLNQTEGGEGISGYKHTEESKRKQSEAATGKKHTEEAKRKISEANSGRTRTEETRRLLSESKKGENNPNFGKELSEETKRLLSVANKGENNPNFGKEHTEEAKRKISEANSGRKHTEETRRLLSELNKNKPLVSCIYCGKVGKAIGGMLSRHLNNCKHKNSTVLPIPQ
jgi:hypothetical protein